MPKDHDYEPDDDPHARKSQMQTDPPCRICGEPKGKH